MIVTGCSAVLHLMGQMWVICAQLHDVHPGTGPAFAGLPEFKQHLAYSSLALTDRSC